MNKLRGQRLRELLFGISLLLNGLGLRLHIGRERERELDRARPHGSRNRVSFDHKHFYIIYAALDNNLKLYASHDQGQTWTERLEIPFPRTSENVARFEARVDELRKKRLAAHKALEKCRGANPLPDD